MNVIISKRFKNCKLKIYSFGNCIGITIANTFDIIFYVKCFNAVEMFAQDYLIKSTNDGSCLVMLTYDSPKRLLTTEINSLSNQSLSD